MSFLHPWPAHSLATVAPADAAFAADSPLVVATQIGESERIAERSPLTGSIGEQTAHAREFWLDNDHHGNVIEHTAYNGLARASDAVRMGCVDRVATGAVYTSTLTLQSPWRQYVPDNRWHWRTSA